MKYFFLPLICAVLTLAGCTPKPLTLSDGTMVGNYNVIYVDVTHRDMAAINASLEKKAIYERVKKRLTEKLVETITPLNDSSRSKQVGITIEIISDIRKTQQQEARIQAQLMIWDAKTRASLATTTVEGWQPSAQPTGGLIGGIIFGITKAVMDNALSDEHESNSVSNFSRQVVTKLFPNPKTK
jgi:hypothetical protein